MWILVNQENGEIHHLSDNKLAFVGREDSNEICISARSVQQWRHAVFAQDAGGSAAHFRLKDLGSQHGTFVNGAKLDPTSSSDDWIVLNDHDTIRFGADDSPTFVLNWTLVANSCPGCVAEQHQIGGKDLSASTSSFHCQKHMPIAANPNNNGANNNGSGTSGGGLIHHQPAAANLYLTNPATLFSAPVSANHCRFLCTHYVPNKHVT